MRIDFTEEGGVAYFPGLRKPVTIEGDRLDPGELDALRRLVDAARFFDLPASLGKPTRGAADYQHYTLTIEDQGRRHSVRVLVPIEDPALQELVTAVQRLVKARRAAEGGRPPASKSNKPL